MVQQTSPRVVICGAGVIGAATAYYLSLRGVRATVIERQGVACAASGKSGGFLALDWCDGSPLNELARTSFALHATLAQTLAVDYGYRRLTTFAVAASAREGLLSRQAPDDCDWLNGNGVVYRRLGTPTTTAQVHPEKFTQALLQAALERGAQLHIGCVKGLEIAGGHIRGVYVDEHILPADTVVIAMGPWSGTLAPWLPLPPVFGLKGHSIIVQPTRPIPAQALFVDYLARTGERLAPEVYPRPDGEVYLCGLSEESPLPEHPEEVIPRPEAGPLLMEVAGALSSSLVGLQPQRLQACYRPICSDGLPLMGRVPEVTGAYIATGHSCWGILNGPASGLAMAELIVDGHAHTVDLSPFAPQRLRAQRVARARGN